MNSEVAASSTVFAVHPARLAWGEYRDEKNQGEGDINASYSADKIGEGKPIRKPFEWQGSLWVCVSLAGRGITVSKELEAEAYRLIPLSLFASEPTTYSERTSTMEAAEAARQDPLGFYHGMKVRHGQDSFVLCGPPAVFIPCEIDNPSPTQLPLF